MVKILQAGDTAVTIEFGDTATRGLSSQVLALDRRLAAAAGVAGIVETVPTMRSLTVYYDPLLTTQAALTLAITPLLAVSATAEAAGRRWTLPVCYDAECAPDLADVAQRTGLPAAEVIRQHAAVAYRVYMLGFLPGQAYLGDLPAALHLPRRTTPRTAVPPGSVAIATTMATIYPLASPGGWHLIGRCPVRLFDPNAASPVLLAPGDEVRFSRIDATQYQTLSDAAEAGSWQPVPEPQP